MPWVRIHRLIVDGDFFRYFATSAFVIISGGVAERIARSRFSETVISISRISSVFSIVTISTMFITPQAVLSDDSLRTVLITVAYNGKTRAYSDFSESAMRSGLELEI